MIEISEGVLVFVGLAGVAGAIHRQRQQRERAEQDKASALHLDGPRATWLPRVEGALERGPFENVAVDTALYEVTAEHHGRNAHGTLTIALVPEGDGTRLDTTLRQTFWHQGAGRERILRTLRECLIEELREEEDGHEEVPADFPRYKGDWQPDGDGETVVLEGTPEFWLSRLGRLLEREHHFRDVRTSAEHCEITAVYSTTWTEGSLRLGLAPSGEGTRLTAIATTTRRILEAFKSALTADLTAGVKLAHGDARDEREE